MTLHHCVLLPSRYGYPKYKPHYCVNPFLLTSVLQPFSGCDYQSPMKTKSRKFRRALSLQPVCKMTWASPSPDTYEQSFESPIPHFNSAVSYTLPVKANSEVHLFSWGSLFPSEGSSRCFSPYYPEYGAEKIFVGNLREQS